MDTCCELKVIIEETLALGEKVLDLMEELVELGTPPKGDKLIKAEKIFEGFPNADPLLFRWAALPDHWESYELEEMYRSVYHSLRRMVSASVSIEEFKDSLHGTDPFDTMILYGAVRSGFNVLSCSLNRHLGHLNHLYSLCLTTVFSEHKKE